MPRKIILYANTDWYLYNFRRSLALAIREAGFQPLLLSPPGPHGARLQALGLDWRPVPMQRRSLNPLREAALLLHLTALLRREKPVLVHGFTIKCAVYGALAARLAGIQARISAAAGMGYVFTSHALKARLLRPPVRGLLRLALAGERARLILQNPDDVALFQQARLIDPARIRLIPGSGVDCRRFTPAPPRAPQARWRVLLPARLLWDKGIAEYVSAARQLHAAGQPIDFLLAGTPDPGNPNSIEEAQIRAWDDAGLIQWLGHVEDMPALLQTVDAVALPSYREGLPKGLIEAAACGLPLVTCDVPGCREVVRDRIEGLRVPAGDAEALAAAIAYLHANPDQAARFGAAARQRALSEFDERSVIAHTLAVYREVLADAGHA